MCKQHREDKNKTLVLLIDIRSQLLAIDDVRRGWQNVPKLSDNSTDSASGIYQLQHVLFCPPLILNK
jgi:hypothetical protein